MYRPNELDAYFMLVIVILLMFTLTNYTWEEYCGGFSVEELPYVQICHNIYEGGSNPL